MEAEEKPHLTLPDGQYRIVDRAIKDSYGKTLHEIAEVDSAFAFHAMRTGLTALFSGKGYRELLEQRGEQRRTVTRHEDGDSAYDGSVSHMVDGLVAGLEGRDQDVLIAVTKRRNLIDKLRRRKAATQIVATIRKSEET